MLERMMSGDRRVINGIMEILVSAGFEGANAHLSYAMIHTYLFGRYQVVLHGDYYYPPGELEDTLAALKPIGTGCGDATFSTTASTSSSTVCGLDCLHRPLLVGAGSLDGPLRERTSARRGSDPLRARPSPSPGR